MNTLKYVMKKMELCNFKQNDALLWPFYMSASLLFQSMVIFPTTFFISLIPCLSFLSSFPLVLIIFQLSLGYSKKVVSKKRRFCVSLSKNLRVQHTHTLLPLIDKSRYRVNETIKLFKETKLMRRKVQSFLARLRISLLYLYT